MTTPEPVRLTHANGVARLTLDRPQRLNTIDLDMARALRDAVLEAVGDARSRVVLLHGAGRAFCAGGDLTTFAGLGTGLPDYLLDVTAALHEALARLVESDVPVVVAVHGAVAGAGLGLASAADLVLAAEGTRFVFGYSLAGLSPDGGTSWFLPRLIGPRLAMAMALENREFDALEAARVGLVTRVVPADELLVAAEQLTTRVAAGPTRSYATTKRLFAASLGRGYREQLEDERRSLSETAATNDGVEGVGAFAERRQPQFRGH